MNFDTSTRSLVIGGSSGIGRAVAEGLKERPGTVAIASRSTGFDVTDAASVATFFEAEAPFDHIVFTAGSWAPGGAVADVDLDEAKAAFDAKFWGSIVVAREAARHLTSGGTLTLTSGFLSRRTVPGTYVKTAMNAAIEAVAKLLARELAPIRVNVVSPGLTDTGVAEGGDESAHAAMIAQAAASTPAGRVGTADDLAQGYLFAIDNPYVSGAVIDIDGGSLIK